MEFEDIKTMLEATGLPVAYHHFDEDVDFPCVVYWLPESNNISADNIVYQHKSLLRIELYNSFKDLASEAKIKAALTNAGISYKQTDSYIEEEKVYQIIYESEILINE